ncbi:pilin [Solilutibacter silvestris]|uniref:Pilin protein n=1 Tax=Solilutibacter silvestris TaxID=1645665 RepID=A0A2K1Q0F4_9GAMM|nr:pilin [Lysobacter silvestris]PNS08520.1 Pilin protein [Lysobacter silvestris]
MSIPPPLPPSLPAASHPRTTAKPPKSNGCLIAFAVCAALCIPLAGILAAIALPAYQQYVLKSKVMAAINATRPVREAIDNRLAHTGQCPGNDDFKGARDVERIEVGQLADDATRCVLALHLGGTGKDQLDGRTIWMDRAKNGDGKWHCRSDIDNRHLPSACRED